MTETASDAASVLGPSLADPQTCGEDLAQSLDRVMAIAPSLCRECADYHIAAVAKRLSGRTVWALGARSALVGELGPILADHVAAGTGRLDVTIAACADTAVLSTSAHAVHLAGGHLLARTNFQVLDLCETPLALCREYSARHGLSVATHATDLTQTSANFPSDIVLLHNFLSYVPQDRHEMLIERHAAWLKPGGRLVIWNNLVTPERREGFLRHLDAQIADIRAMVHSGRLGAEVRGEELLARVERTAERSRRSSHRVADTESVSRLIARAGLNILSTWEMHPHGLAPDPSEVAFPCAMIVAGRRSAQP
jgi:hypothetical protein